jgi:hypothetical protein
VKVLLDENLPHDLRHHFAGYEVYTVAFKRWSGIKNGALLRLAANDGFDVMVTLDDGVTYQQNAASLPLAVVILSAQSSDIEDLLPLVPALLVRLSEVAPRSFARVP